MTLLDGAACVLPTVLSQPRSVIPSPGAVWPASVRLFLLMLRLLLSVIIPERSNTIVRPAAGVLLIQEAGGLVTDFDGGENYLATGNVVGGNPKVFSQLLQVIQPHMSARLRSPMPVEAAASKQE